MSEAKNKSTIGRSRGNESPPDTYRNLHVKILELGVVIVRHFAMKFITSIFHTEFELDHS